MLKRKDGQMISKYNAFSPMPTTVEIWFEEIKDCIFFSGSCPEITAKVTKILSNKEYFKRLALMIPLWFAVGLGWVYKTFNH